MLHKKQIYKCRILVFLVLTLSSMVMYTDVSAKPTKKATTTAKPETRPTPKQTTKASATPKPSYDTDPFSYLKGNDGGGLISGNETLQKSSASWYALMVSIAVLGVVLSILAFVLVTTMSRDGHARSEARKKLIVKLAIFVFIVSISFFATQVYLMSKAFM